MRIPQLWCMDLRQECGALFNLSKYPQYMWDVCLEGCDDNILIFGFTNLHGVEFLPLRLQCRYSLPCHKLHIADDIDEQLELPLWDLVSRKVFTLALRPEPPLTCKHRCSPYSSRYLSEFSLPLLLQVNNFWRWGLICDR